MEEGVAEKGRHADGRMKGVVVRKFEFRKKGEPVVLMVGDEGAEVGFDDLVHTLGLAGRLVVVGRGDL